MLDVEFHDGVAVEYHCTADGVDRRENPDYRPTLYVGGPADALRAAADGLAPDPKVARTSRTRRYPDLHADERTTVLAVECARSGDPRRVAREARARHADDYAPGVLRFYGVDLAPKFRYCLATGTDPTPARALRTLALDCPTRALANGDLSALRVDGDPAGDTDRAALRALADRLAAVDPDVLVLSDAALVPLVHDRAAALGVDCHLGREAGHTQLAGANTYESYGQVGHAPARYDVPGRVLVDRSNSFLYGEAGLHGLLALVERSWRPLQETAWGSIGTVLTAIQVREARDRDVLVPWQKWEPERFKPVRVLHAADRGGHAVEPEPGHYEDVVEVDFASLYPRIICEHNVSPETVDCACHRERADVPELGYALCDERGFLPDVLEPLLADRADAKARLRDDPPADERARLEAVSSALKWVLVSCFGYQGYRNAKFGRIECHEAINAVARETLLDAKAAFEDAGWRVVHGIVDSLWVTPAAEDPDPVADVVARVTADAGVPLEREARYDWVSVLPTRDGRRGALTSYVGRRTGVARDDPDAFKYRGVACRRRSTSPFVADAQRDLFRAFDARRTPEAVVERLGVHLATLRGGRVDPADLAVTRRAGKRRDDYDADTRVTAALDRYADRGVDRHPGQSVRYVVVDDGATGRERVRCAFEDPTDYDADCYATRLVRAATEVVSPLGWDEARVRRALRDTAPTDLRAFE
ncbi:MAG: type B DNA-directed DNA polymerase [Halobacteriaceae archaeon]